MAEVVAQLKEQVASQNKELEYARLKIQVLEERLRLVRISEIWAEQREAEQFATRTTGTRARRQPGRSSRRKRAQSSSACY